MKINSILSAYEAPQAELLFVHIEQNFLDSQTGAAGTGSNLTKGNDYDNSDFDDLFE